MNSEVVTNSYWPDSACTTNELARKIRTAVLYDKNHNIVAWGNKALNYGKLGKKCKRRKDVSDDHILVDLFMLELSSDILYNTLYNTLNEFLESISERRYIDYKKAITDYLYGFGLY